MPRYKNPRIIVWLVLANDKSLPETHSNIIISVTTIFNAVTTILTLG